MRTENNTWLVAQDKPGVGKNKFQETIMVISKIINLLLSIKKIHVLRFSIGVIYIWFGSLKFFSGLSPAEELASETLKILTFQMIPYQVSYFLLALLETIIGVMLIINIFPRTAIIMALSHMACTFTPMILMPGISFNNSLFSMTLIGQYIVKNLVIISALLVLYPLKNKPEV
ncbi:DoxX family protein [Fulvivirgaceae bacterium BMA12]|uniref:DoxX family protein n=1 Tax=Agaribacillus aureus TaxID=3051825 RepID=A0ABT8LFM3_9BACT|nr:DoxX family protein [Fulvivirgaceae bacterium BMA12]